MGGRSPRLLAPGLLGCVLLVAAPRRLQCQEDAPSDALRRVLAMEPMELLRACLAKTQTLDAFTQVATKRERIKGRLNPVETMFLKCRAEPLSIYMKWITKPYKGREVIYVKGKNGGKSIVHHYAGPFNIHLKVDPFGARVQKRSRRPVTRAGVRNSTKALLDLCETALKRGHMQLTVQGTEELDGRTVVVLQRLLEKHPDYGVHKALIYIDPKQMLPVKCVGYDWDDRLQWVYETKTLCTDVQLTDKDFDPKNPKYRYPDGVVDLHLRMPWPFRGK